MCQHQNDQTAKIISKNPLALHCKGILYSCSRIIKIIAQTTLRPSIIHREILYSKKQRVKTKTKNIIICETVSEASICPNVTLCIFFIEHKHRVSSLEFFMFIFLLFYDKKYILSKNPIHLTIYVVTNLSCKTNPFHS